MATDEQGPAWIPCMCGEWWCRIHQQHAHECDCPSVESCTYDPYLTGGPPMKSWERYTIEEMLNEMDKKVPS